ncbi:uncharacterized protein LOC116204567 [Punica granatum]|uniref:Uncharacterized protein n=2 Tax=Punica granatum TaxID=22663 RepID=A0A2I0J3C8_PUNGR|nr:uncharacterized protein LOC116204567 [Punica granatum]PKI50734.1 hypothetical protein CRG98_028876 [Punica granatum]
MSVVKVKTSNALGGVKLEEGNESLNTLARQGIGKEPFLSVPRSTDNPVQLIQFLHAFDNQDIPGWPFLTQVKVPMQKCDKCNREFFSPINYRRHMRVHHRLKKLDKDSMKNRDLLRVFWDKLSADEAKEIVALKNASVEDLPGATVIKTLASLIRKPGFPPLPHFCIKSGSALLEIVQARPSRFSISSQELFSILDDASEKTFLSGPAISMQKYLFDGEAAKIGLDTKNLVAFTSFLLEQKLIEAWLADKDAEALRCQKLLVEEEEAAQKRQAELLERKRRKKLRQKEQKAKEHRNEEVVRDSFNSMAAEPPSQASAHDNASDSESQDLDGPSEISLFEMSQIPSVEDVDSEANSGVGFVDNDSNACQNIEPRSHQSLGVPNWHAPPKPRAMSNGFYQMKNSSSSKPEFKSKNGIRDLRVAHTVNNKKVWSRKPKPEKDGENLKFRVQEAFVQVGQDKEHELLIGSIAVNLGSSHTREKCDNAHFPEDDGTQEYQPSKKFNNAHEKNSRSDSNHSGASQSTVKHWRRRQEVKDSVPVQRESEVNSSFLKDDDQTVNNEECLRSSSLNGHHCEIECHSLPSESNRPGNLHFSSDAARTFLSQRWKEAIAADHVKLVLLPELEPSAAGTQDCTDVSDSDKRSILRNAEDRMVNGPSASGPAKPELKMKPEKGLKKRYILKQRANDT